MKRADILLVERGQVESRTQAQRLIQAGKVSWREGERLQRVDKPGHKLPEDAQFEVSRDAVDRYVSRGGIKLAAALEKLALDVRNLQAIDVGASTGGFTDCLLQAGVAQVVCVDVGHDQLAAKLRNDPRVHNYEGINARDLPRSLLSHAPDGFDLAVMDVSFISQTKILPSLVSFLAHGALLITLVKPQFELGPEAVGKGGIVRDQSHYPALENSIRVCCEALGIQVLDYFDSPITGGDGNREFLLVGRYLARNTEGQI